MDTLAPERPSGKDRGSGPFVTECQLVAALTIQGFSEDPQIQLALRWAKHFHREQKRKGGGPVLEEHIYPVVMTAMKKSSGFEWQRRKTIIISLLLHDHIEDAVSEARAEAQLIRVGACFGLEVRAIVSRMTVVGESAAEYYAEIAQDEDTVFCKMCDCLNNSEWVKAIACDEIVRRVCDRTMQFAFPMLLPRWTQEAIELLVMTFEARLRALR